MARLVACLPVPLLVPIVLVGTIVTFLPATGAAAKATSLLVAGGPLVLSLMGTCMFTA